MSTIVLPETIQPYDASRVKVGDHLVLRLEVRETTMHVGELWLRHPANRMAHINISNTIEAHAHIIGCEAIIGHEPAPPVLLAVGEKVRLKNHTVASFQIIGADGDDAWLRGVAGDHYSVSFSQLERAE